MRIWMLLRVCHAYFGNAQAFTLFASVRISIQRRWIGLPRRLRAGVSWLRLVTEDSAPRASIARCNFGTWSARASRQAPHSARKNTATRRERLASASGTGVLP
jgi:hypothetical protein